MIRLKFLPEYSTYMDNYALFVLKFTCHSIPLPNPLFKSPGKILSTLYATKTVVFNSLVLFLYIYVCMLYFLVFSSNKGLNKTFKHFVPIKKIHVTLN